MKKYILFTILFSLLIIASITHNSYAADLDEIINYIVIVEPRMEDGTLDITYEVTWKVLNSTAEGPLEWAQIGTPNTKFDNPTALSTNIKSISKYKDTYVKIVFDRAYRAGEQLTFKYKIHQSYMYTLKNQNCEYSFTPAWFKDARIDNMTIMWKANNIKSSNSQAKEGQYLIWHKTNMAKGAKMTAEIKYDKSAFKKLDENKQASNAEMGSYTFLILLFLSIVIIIRVVAGTLIGGSGYYRHRGFYGGHSYRRGSSYYGRSCASSCACVSSCACACACAGSGRAGCSKKDFYGTKLNKEKIRNVIKKG